MSLNFLHLNQEKSEVIVFGSTSSNCTPPVNLGFLEGLMKPVVTDLGVKIDADLKLDLRIAAVVKASFFQLRKLA